MKKAAEQKEKDYCLEVFFSDDESVCTITLETFRSTDEIVPELIQEVLHKSGVIYGIKRRAVEQLAAKTLFRKMRVEHSVVAEGLAAVDDKDAHIDYSVKPSGNAPVYSADEEGSVDFKVTRRFENVVRGSVVGEWIAVQQGKDGLSVTGRTIRHREIKKNPSKPEAYILDGVVYIPSRKQFVATRDGRLVVSGNSVKLVNRLVVDGNVNLSTGHIDFVGFVHVKGDVLNGFHVRGVQGVCIDGNVGDQCRVESEGDISLNGMVCSTDKGHISCGATLTANYLRNVHVESLGDIRVRSEALHCHLRSAASVKLDGVLAGGTCMALGGIEAQTLGSDIGIRTVLTSGKDFRIMPRFEALRTDLEEVRERRTSLSKEVAPYKNRNLSFLSYAMKRRISRKLQDIRNLFQIEDRLIKEMESLRETEQSNYANEKINVKRRICQGAVLKLGETTRNINRNMPGAYSVIELVRGKLRFLPRSPLTVNGSKLKKLMIKSELIRTAALNPKAAKGVVESA